MADDPKTKAQERKDEATAERERLERESTAEIERNRAAKQIPAPADEDKNTAAARQRAFEDAVFGKDAVRVGGRIERGHGSPFAKMTEEQRRQYDAIEALVAAEQKLADAHSALIQAEEDHKAAVAATEPKPDPEAEAIAAKEKARAAGG